MKNMPREKLLLIALAVIIIAWQGNSLFQSLIVEPISARKASLASLKESLQDKQLEERRLKLATEQLKDWSARSLPPDPKNAVSLYQNWLYESASAAKLTNIVVDNLKFGTAVRAASARGAGQRGGAPKDEVYHVVGAKITGKGTLEQLTDYLHNLRRSGLLHRVSQLAINSPRHEGDPVLDVTINVEALSLANSPPRTTLLADPEHPPQPDKVLQDRQAFAALTEKSLFVRGYTGPPRPAPSPNRTIVEQLPDTAEFVHLTSCVSENGKPDATLFDRTANKYTNLAVGGEFSVAGLSGKVVTIGKDFVLFEIKGEFWRLELGQHLRQMQKMPAASPA